MTVKYVIGSKMYHLRDVLKRANRDKEEIIVEDYRRYEQGFLGKKVYLPGERERNMERAVRNHYIIGELPPQISFVNTCHNPVLFMYGKREEILTDLANGLDQSPQLEFGKKTFPCLAATKADGKMVFGIGSFEGEVGQKDSWEGGGKTISHYGMFGRKMTEDFEWWNIRPGLYGTATSSQVFTIKASFFEDFFRTLTAG